MKEPYPGYNAERRKKHKRIDSAKRKKRWEILKHVVPGLTYIRPGK